MGLAEIGGRVLNAAADALQDGIDLAREAVRNAGAVTNLPVEDGAERLLLGRAVVASDNTQDGTGQTSFTPATQTPTNPAAPSAAGAVLVQTSEVAIRLESTPASDPSDPPVDRIVFDTGGATTR